MNKTIAGIILTVASATAFAEPPHAEEAAEKVEGSAMTPDRTPPSAPPLPRHCKYHADMEKFLNEKHGEYSVFAGIQRGGKTMREIFVNTSTGTYTVTTITPKKQHDNKLVSCIISTGTGGMIRDASRPHTI